MRPLWTEDDRAISQTLRRQSRARLRLPTPRHQHRDPDLPNRVRLRRRHRRGRPRARYPDPAGHRGRVRALARCQACSSTPIAPAASMRSPSATRGVPISTTARITAVHPSPNPARYGDDTLTLGADPARHPPLGPLGQAGPGGGQRRGLRPGPLRATHGATAPDPPVPHQNRRTAGHRHIPQQLLPPGMGRRRPPASSTSDTCRRCLDQNLKLAALLAHREHDEPRQAEHELRRTTGSLTLH